VPALDPEGPRPEDVAELWADHAEMALTSWQDLFAAYDDESEEGLEDRAEAAYDLLAGWGALLRLRPDLLWVAPDDLLDRVEAAVRRDAEKLATAALRVPAPEGWLEEAREWGLQSDDLELPPEEAAASARELWIDLDDACLVAWAADELAPGAGSDALADALLPCLEHVAAEPESFLPAEVFLRCGAAAMDPAAAARHGGLLLTLEPWCHVLAEVAAAWRADERFTAPLPEAEAAAWRELAAKLVPAAPSRWERLLEELRRLDHRVRAWAGAPLGVPAHAVLAAHGASPGAEEGPLRRWRGADGSWQGFLRLPPPAEARDDAEVELVLPEGAAAGDHVLLAGVERELAAQGDIFAARFRLAELREGEAAAPAATLCLIRRGVDGEDWSLGIPEEAEGWPTRPPRRPRTPA